MPNKYNLYDILKNQYKKTISTLKATSLDDRKRNKQTFFCQDDSLEVFYFDKIKDIVYKNQKAYKSPDAIYIKKKNVFIIEFKNQNPCDIDSSAMKEKLGMPVDFFTKQIPNLKDYIFVFCLVYKEQSQSKISQRYKQGLQIKACCDLEDENINNLNNFYNTIITKDIEYYKNNFSQLKC